MKLTVFNLGLLTVGIYLAWCGITDRHPVETARSVLTGNGIPGKGSWKSPTGGDPANDKKDDELEDKKDDELREN